MLTREELLDLWSEFEAKTLVEDGNIYGAWNVRLDAASRPYEERYHRLRITDATGGNLGADWYAEVMQRATDIGADVSIQNNAIELS